MRDEEEIRREIEHLRKIPGETAAIRRRGIEWAMGGGWEYPCDQFVSHGAGEWCKRCQWTKAAHGTVRMQR